MKRKQAAWASARLSASCRMSSGKGMNRDGKARVYFSTQVPKMFLVLSKQPQSQLAVKLAVTGAVVPWTVVQLGCDSSSSTMDSSPAGARLEL